MRLGVAEGRLAGQGLLVESPGGRRASIPAAAAISAQLAPVLRAVSIASQRCRRIRSSNSRRAATASSASFLDGVRPTRAAISASTTAASTSVDAH